MGTAVTKVTFGNCGTSESSASNAGQPSLVGVIVKDLLG
jgi:hypothetical protein